MFGITQGYGRSPAYILTGGYGTFAPPVPVNELIARDILATVNTVTIANGYNYDLTVQRHSKAGDKRDHLNTIITQDDTREASEPEVYFTKEWIATYMIGVYIMPLDNDTTPIDTYVNIIRADVEKALMVDIYRSGNALNTTIRAPKQITDEGLEYDIIVINVDVNYRTLENDPYTNAR